jgi:hypothetical protein
VAFAREFSIRIRASLETLFEASSRIAAIVVEQVAMDRVEIVRVAGHGVERRRIEE